MSLLQLLLLPAVVDTLQLDPPNCDVSGWMKVSPEPLDEQSSALDLLHNGKKMRKLKVQMKIQIKAHVFVLLASLPKASADISQYDEPRELKENKLNESLIESEFSGKSTNLTSENKNNHKDSNEHKGFNCNVFLRSCSAAS